MHTPPNENSTHAKSPVFIVGAPRSGTTLMQYILRSFPSLSIPTGESHFFIPLFRNEAQYGDLSHIYNVKRVLQAMEAQSAEFLHTDMHGIKFDVETLAHEFVAEGRNNMRDIITGLFEKNAAGEGKLRWCEKTPYYVLHIPKLLEWWPDAQIIHVIRDGRDVALSMLARRHDFGVYNIYIAAKHWEHYVETGRALGRQVGEGQYLELRYEDLISDQKAATQKICGFLGEEYSDDLLEFKKSGIAGKTPLLQKSIQKDNQDKWKSEMTSWQIRVFESVAASALKEFNYRLVTTGRILPLPLRVFYRWQNAFANRWHHLFGSKQPAWVPPSN